jgi:hypothetical protein
MKTDDIVASLLIESGREMALGNVNDGVELAHLAIGVRSRMPEPSPVAQRALVKLVLQAVARNEGDGLVEALLWALLYSDTRP